MWRPKPCYHSLGSGVLRKFTANFPHFRRADVSSAVFDSGRKMLDTCLHSVRPIQQPDSRVTTSCHAQVRRSHRHGYTLQVAELCRGVRESQV